MSETMYEIKNEEKLDGSQVKLTIELSAEAVSKEEPEALKEVSKTIEMDGFRKGAALPKDVIVSKVGELPIMEQSAYRAINKMYGPLLEEKEFRIISKPEISITKLAVGSPIEFTITLTLLPEITLPDFKKIAKAVKKETTEETTEKELTDHIERIKTSYAQNMSQVSQDNKEGDDSDKKEEIPELNDEFVKKLGEFKDVADFKAKMRESIQKEKEQHTFAKRRQEIVDGIIKETKGDMPESMVEEELQGMLAQLMDDVKRMGVENEEEYFKAINKTKEELKEEWRGDASKRAMMNLALPEIAKAEGIKPDSEKAEEQIKMIKEQHKDNADKIDNFRLRVYVESALLNEAVLKYLEELK
jgi:FKBP-type peptidyl-prolyl cis-trans isomerase (trigger factor)